MTWHLDEVYLKIDGRMVYLWRAVDAEGEVLDVLVQTRRNKRAALNARRTSKCIAWIWFKDSRLATKRARLRKEGWRWTRSSVGFIVAALVAVAWLLTAPPPEPPPPPPAWIHWKTVAPIEEKAFIGDDLRVPRHSP